MAITPHSGIPIASVSWIVEMKRGCKIVYLDEIYILKYQTMHVSIVKMGYFRKLYAKYQLWRHISTL